MAAHLDVPRCEVTGPGPHAPSALTTMAAADATLMTMTLVCTAAATLFCPTIAMIRCSGRQS